MDTCTYHLYKKNTLENCSNVEDIANILWICVKTVQIIEPNFYMLRKVLSCLLLVWYVQDTWLGYFSLI